MKPKSRGRPKATLVLTDEESAELRRHARRSTGSQHLALRSKIVLHRASNDRMAARSGRGLLRTIFADAVARFRMMLPALLVCCEAADERPDQEGNYVDLYLPDGLQPCGAQMASLDQFIEDAFRFYADTSPGSIRANVRAVREVDDTPCSVGQACVVGGTAWLTRDLGQYHELVHLMQIELDGRSIPSLEEGTAEALGSYAPVAYGSMQVAESDASFLFEDDVAELDYPLSAMFSRFIIDEHGIDDYRDFFRDIGGTGGPDGGEYRSVFESTFGVSFDASWTSFVSAPRCAYDLWFCREPDPVELSLDVNGIDCASPDAFGYEDSESDSNVVGGFQSFQLHYFSTETSEMLTFEFARATVYVGQCGTCEQQFPTFEFVSTDPPGLPPLSLDQELEAGLHVVILRAHGTGTPSLHVRRAG